jgi:RsiW-degrading membrane proteinase PrsW (M82 family)
MVEENQDNLQNPLPGQLPEIPPPPLPGTKLDKSNEDVKTELPPTSISTRVTDRVTGWAGVERLEGFKLGDVFSEALKRHSRDEVEEYFTVGTPSSTPPIDAIETGWPKPWMFLRTFAAAGLMYLVFVQAWHEYGNDNLIPGLIMVGSFAVPISALIFFIEMNARKNVSLYQVMRLLFFGGLLSIIISLFFFDLTDGTHLNWLGASMAGLVEEPGKLLALILVINIVKFRYILNGLLFGAAVGTGFAAFESMGYALRSGFEYGGEAMLDNIMLRGMLSPFSHIIWTAMCGAALWRVKGGKAFKFDMLYDPRFYRIFFMAIILHMIWNSPVNLPFYGKYIILGITGWIVVFALIQAGLKQIQEEKKAHMESMPYAGA